MFNIRNTDSYSQENGHTNLDFLIHTVIADDADYFSFILIWKPNIEVFGKLSMPISS